MKNSRPQTIETGSPKKRRAVQRFVGTDNSDELLVIHALMLRPMPRHHLNRFIGSSNASDLICSLREKGLSIPDEEIEDLDQDGKHILRTVNHFSKQDMRSLSQWLSKRKFDEV